LDHFPIKILADKSILIKIKEKIYCRQAITATSYKFTDKCNIFIDEIDENIYGVYFKNKSNKEASLEEIANEFCNELIDQQTRIDIEKEFGNIRDKIVEAAFSPIVDLK